MCTYIIIYVYIYLCILIHMYVCIYVYSYTYAVIFFRQIMVPVVEVKYLLNIITYVLVVSWPPDECLAPIKEPR